VTPLGLAALALASRGLRVFPIIARTKNPAIKDNLRLATIDEGIIRAWWRNLDFNVAIATGPNSGVWVLDIDGEEGESTLRRLETQHGALPATVESITGGGGRHLFWRWPAGAEIRNSQVRADLPGIDVRANGGFVVAPPSIHPSGSAYAWSVDSASEFAEAPEWLIDIVARRQTREPVATPPEAWRSFIDDAYAGSHRGHAVARLSGLLLRKYLDPHVVVSLCQIFNTDRCVEPLARAEVFRIVNDIARREADRRDQADAQASGQGG
jgi:Bifunctional DNA primase/polymerase, N-terminal